jgi:histidinol-phosphate/aromatic aminotransferase/cobyric acid decarboxylase-like protein
MSKTVTRRTRVCPHCGSGLRKLSESKFSARTSIVTVGSNEAMYLSLMVLAEAGDEVLMPIPVSGLSGYH